MKKILTLSLILIISLSSCGKHQVEELKSIIPEYFIEQITTYQSYNPQKLNDYYYAYLNHNSYIYALNLVNHPDFLTPGAFYQTYQDNTLMLVNKKFYLSDNNFPENLVKLSGINYIQRKNEEMLINQEALNHLQEMTNFAKKQHLDLIIFSAFRTYEKQISLWKNKTYFDSLYLAIPGHSEHHTGLAIDIGTMNSGLTNHFEKTSVFKFLEQYASKYGFILRYPKNKTPITGYAYEPWHFRYVGVTAATIIKEENLTLEEYLYKYTLLPLSFVP